MYRRGLGYQLVLQQRQVEQVQGQVELPNQQVRVPGQEEELPNQQVQVLGREELPNQQVRVLGQEELPNQQQQVRVQEPQGQHPKSRMAVGCHRTLKDALQSVRRTTETKSQKKLQLKDENIPVTNYIENAR